MVSLYLLVDLLQLYVVLLTTTFEPETHENKSSASKPACFDVVFYLVIQVL